MSERPEAIDFSLRFALWDRRTNEQWTVFAYHLSEVRWADIWDGKVSFFDVSEAVTRDFMRSFRCLSG